MGLTVNQLQSSEESGEAMQGKWIKLAVLGMAILPGFACSAFAQNPQNALTDTLDGTLFATLAFGNLTAGTSNVPVAVQTQFRLRNRMINGYRVDAQATLNVTPSAPADGGATISAADIGVGITSVIAGAGVLTPRGDTITGGFNYDPGLVTAVNGLTPYTGAGFGRANLGNLAANTRILSGSQIANDAKQSTPGNYLTVTMRFGVLPQFFTPASFSAVVTLTISNGP